MKRKTQNLVMLSMTITAFAAGLAIYATFQYFSTLFNEGIHFNWIEVFFFLFVTTVKVLAPIEENKAAANKVVTVTDFYLSYVIWSLSIVASFGYSLFKIASSALSFEGRNNALDALACMVIVCLIFYLEYRFIGKRARAAIKEEETERVSPAPIRPTRDK